MARRRDSLSSPSSHSLHHHPAALWNRAGVVAANVDTIIGSANRSTRPRSRTHGSGRNYRGRHMKMPTFPGQPLTLSFLLTTRILHLSRGLLHRETLACASRLRGSLFTSSALRTERRLKALTDTYAAPHSAESEPSFGSTDRETGLRGRGQWPHPHAIAPVSRRYGSISTKTVW